MTNDRLVLKPLCVLLALLIPAGCGEPTRVLPPPPDIDDGWLVASPAEMGFDADALVQLTEDIATGEFPNTHAVLIEHDSRLVFEQYFEGPDERWGEPLGHRVFDRDSLHDLRSVSKSVTSMALGIALSDQFEAELGKPIPSFFPSLDTDLDSQAVTLHQALTMTAGLEWNEMTVPYTDETNDELRLYDVQDPVALVLKRPLRETPGTVWYYNGGLSQVIAGIVQQVSGQTLEAYAGKVIFEPLGITEFEWLGGPLWDPPMPAAASGLRMRARDLAKIGSVYLHQGKWNDQQIVSAGWVERSMQRHVVEIGDWSSDGIWGYGYQWWVGRFPQGYEVAAAVGNGNQRIFIVPAEKMVVTIFAGEYNKFEGHSERLLHRIMEAR